MTTEPTTLPRGVRTFFDQSRPKPFAVQWRLDGKRKTKFFKDEKRRDAWALGLAKDAKAVGTVDAYRLDSAEVQAWRAFRLLVGDANLDDVARTWLKSSREPTSVVTVTEAVAAYRKAKIAEGLSKTTLAHSKAIFNKFEKKLGKLPVADVTREHVADWIAHVPGVIWTRRTHLIRVRSLFNWLRVTRQVQFNPCEGIKTPEPVMEDIPVMTPAQCIELFKQNRDQPKELLGRLALEAFAGMRFSTAGVFAGKDIRWDEKGLVIPAKSIKTRRRQFIDGMPDNLFAWLKWSEPDTWTMTPRKYMLEKSLAFVRAKVPHPHNVLRHSCATYLVAHLRDVGKAAAILCHSPAMLFRHYRGNATPADGDAWSQINP